MISLTSFLLTPLLHATTKQDILNQSVAGTHGRLNYRYVAAQKTHRPF
ncbi:hypothetical protein JD969_04575 [Planctomycetota bacterium]|nr:hypothetical protein JD969_04575 [Planctomycetota bacterium]